MKFTYSSVKIPKEIINYCNDLRQTKTPSFSCYVQRSFANFNSYNRIDTLLSFLRNNCSIICPERGFPSYAPTHLSLSLSLSLSLTQGVIGFSLFHLSFCQTCVPLLFLRQYECRKRLLVSTSGVIFIA